MSEEKIIFNAALHMKNGLAISSEHLNICEPCIQRTANHALGTEDVNTNEEIVKAAKFASDAVTMVTDIMGQINTLMTKLNNMIEDAVKASKELDKIMEKQAAIKAGRALTQGQKIGTAIVTVISSVVGLIIIL